MLPWTQTSWSESEWFSPQNYLPHNGRHANQPLEKTAQINQAIHYVGLQSWLLNLSCLGKLSWEKATQFAVLLILHRKAMQ